MKLLFRFTAPYKDNKEMSLITNLEKIEGLTRPAHYTRYFSPSKYAVYMKRYLIDAFKNKKPHK